MAEETSAFGILAGLSLGGVWIVASGLYDRAFRRRASLVEDTQKEREGLNQRQADMLDSYLNAIKRAESDTDRERKRRLSSEAEADDLSRRLDDSNEDTRAWKARAHALKHELENTRTIVDHLMEARGVTAIEWFDETLPLLIEIRADNAARKNRYAEWRSKQTTLRAVAAAELRSPALKQAIGQFLIPAEHVDDE